MIYLLFLPALFLLQCPFAFSEVILHLGEGLVRVEVKA
jgi:hypothetical protein